MDPFESFTKDEIEQSIPSRFEKQVGRYPQRLAVKTRHGSLTYSALNQAANRLARGILARCGSGTEAVALFLERGAEMLVAILATLKAGKCYVPLDPAFPQSRIAYMHEDSQAKLLVTNTTNLARAQGLAGPGHEILNIDMLGNDISTDNLDLTISPDSLAHILYTSGSTGKPKGVAKNHRNILKNVRDHTFGLKIVPEDRLTLLTSCSFQGAVKQRYGALLNGAAVFVFDPAREGLENLAPWLIAEGITIYHSAPTLFRYAFRTLDDTHAFPCLRVVALGGEPAYRTDVELYRKHFSAGCILVNTPGCTETGVYRHYFMDKDTPFHESVLPLGYAIEGSDVLLLDESGNDVGAGREGEIVVKSRYLSPGYWRRPELNEASFAPVPEGDGVRLYRTGDLGLMRPDGCLLFRGRTDFQVKVRGNRVEVAEIEMALLEHSAVKDAAVAPREDQRGETRLVAYVVPKMNSTPSVSALQRHVRERLPDFMVPAACIFLEALPLTPTGKVDRRALPPITPVNPLQGQAYVAPRTPVEEQLAGIWAEVLRLDCVGVHDDFLALGGHSLLAMQVVTRVRDTWRVEVPLRTLLEAPTVAHMAVAVLEDLTHSVDPGELDRLLEEAEALPGGNA